MEISRLDIDALASLVAKEVGAHIMASLCPGRWLTLKEAMSYAKVKSVGTIRVWISNGFIYAHKRSGQWIVDRESIDNWYSSEKVS